MPSSAYSEYHDTLRVDSYTIVPPGYKYFNANQWPLPALQYAREMTLARGRLLYEVWDQWHNMFIGYIVPTSIFNEALANRERPSLGSWSQLPRKRRILHYQTHSLITEHFPRIPLLSAKLITETLVVDRSSVPPSYLIEEAIITHAKHRWTSYHFRVQSKRQSPWEASKSVKRRMREILEGWLPASMSWNSTVSFWRKHDLIVEEDEELNKVLGHGSSVLHWYAGAETNANLISASVLPM